MLCNRRGDPLKLKLVGSNGLCSYAHAEIWVIGSGFEGEEVRGRLSGAGGVCTSRSRDCEEEARGLRSIRRGVFMALVLPSNNDREYHVIFPLH